MKKIIPSRPKTWRQWGQTLALMAIALPALIGAIGLATDVGNFYYNYYKLQTAADSAVLAGAHCLPSGNGCNGTCGTGSTSPCAPSATANYYATLSTNGISSGEITGTTVGGGGTTITMGISRTVPYYFARLVGVPQGTVNVSATAQGGSAGTINLNNILPVGLQVCGDPSHTVATCTTPYTVGTTLTFNEKGTAPGNWDPLSLPGSSVSICPCASCTPPTSSGCISSNTGCAAAKSAADNAQSLIAAGLAKYPSATALSHTLDDPRAVAVPLVDWTGIAGTKPMDVYGFAEIWLNSTTIGAGCSTNPAINATFITQVDNAQVDRSGTAFDVGALAVKIIQ